MEIRFIRSNGLSEELENIFQRSKRNEKFNNLYRKVYSKKVINLSLDLIFQYDKSTWKIFKEELLNDKEKFINKIIHYIKYSKPFKSKSILFMDRIIERCFYIVLEPILEGQLSKRVFGGRVNVLDKHAFASISNIIWKRTLPNYCIEYEMDVKELSSNDILNSLRNNFGVKDINFLNRLGKIINLNNSDYFKDLLLNILFRDMDDFLNGNIVHYQKVSKNGSKSFHRLDNYINKHNCLPLTFSRYGESLRVLTFNRKLSIDIINMIDGKLDSLDSVIEVESKYYSLDDKNEITFANYKARKGENGLLVSYPEYRNIIRNIKSVSNECIKKNNFSKFSANVLYDFIRMDICTNVSHYFNWLNTSFNYLRRGGKPKIENIRKDDQEQFSVYLLKSGNAKRGRFILPIWKMRQNTNKSISVYMSKVPFRKSYIDDGEVNLESYTKDLVNNDYNSLLLAYIPALMNKQNFRCWVTNQILIPGRFEIHHIKPLSKGGDNSLKNLVILDKDIHKYLHKNNLPESLSGTSLKRFKSLKEKLL